MHRAAGSGCKLMVIHDAHSHIMSVFMMQSIQNRVFAQQEKTTTTT